MRKIIFAIVGTLALLAPKAFADYPTPPPGGGTVTADSPLTGNGSSGSHLACSLCALTSTQIIAGAGLTGGGDLSANRTLSILSGGVTNAMLVEPMYDHSQSGEANITNGGGVTNVVSLTMTGCSNSAVIEEVCTITNSTIANSAAIKRAATAYFSGGTWNIGNGALTFFFPGAEVNNGAFGADATHLICQMDNALNATVRCECNTECR